MTKKTTIRLLNSDKECVHEFTTETPTDSNDVIIWGPTGIPYLFEDQGVDEEGEWEEWIEGRFVNASPDVC